MALGKVELLAATVAAAGGTQGLKGSGYRSDRLRAGSSEKQKSLLGHRTQGAGTGWDGGNQLNPMGTCNIISPDSPGHLCCTCSCPAHPAELGGQERPAPSWASAVRLGSLSPSWGQRCSMVHSSWCTVSSKFPIPLVLQHPLSSRHIEAGIFSSSLQGIRQTLLVSTWRDPAGACQGDGAFPHGLSRALKECYRLASVTKGPCSSASHELTQQGPQVSPAGTTAMGAEGAQRHKKFLPARFQLGGLTRRVSPCPALPACSVFHGKRVCWALLWERA